MALNFAVSAAGAMQIVNTVVLVRSMLGLGEKEVALAFAAAGGGSMLVALLLPKVLDRLPERPVMMLGGIIMAFGLYLRHIVCGTCRAMVATGCRRFDGHAPCRALAQAFLPA